MREVDELDRQRLEAACDHALVLVRLLDGVKPTALPNIVAIRTHARAAANALRWATRADVVVTEDDGQPE